MADDVSIGPIYPSSMLVGVGCEVGVCPIIPSSVPGFVDVGSKLRRRVVGGSETIALPFQISPRSKSVSFILPLALSRSRSACPTLAACASDICISLSGGARTSSDVARDMARMRRTKTDEHIIIRRRESPMAA